MIARQATAGAAAARRTPMRMLIVVFALLAALTAIQAVLARRAAGEPGDVLPTVAYSVAVWLAWLALVPAIVRLGRRFDFAPPHRLASFAVHLTAAFAAHVMTTLVAVWVGVRLYNPDEAITFEMLRQATLLSSRLPLSLLTYAGVLALDRVLMLYQVLTDRELVAARLEAQATQARLEALAARLHPHFLFNALQSASAMVEQDPSRARTMLALIGDLLRDVLSGASDADIPLEEELRYLGRYLAIEEMRFADRLQVRVEVDPEARAVRVPPFLLQPLAENALRHGLAPRPEGGTLRITAGRDGDRLEVRVWNDGEPLPRPVREGVGLTTTRERLAARYGEAASVSVVGAADGVTTIVRVPA